MTQMTKLPLDTKRGVFVEVEMPILGELFVTKNGRWGIVQSVTTKFTKGGYGVLNVEFENIDPDTLEVKTEWACISPMA